MKIPKTITVAGHVVTVIQDHDLDGRQDVQGYASYWRNEILLPPATGMSESHLAYILFHELLHHVSDRYVTPSLTEAQVVSLGEGLLQVIRVNAIDLGAAPLPIPALVWVGGHVVTVRRHWRPWKPQRS